EQERVRPVTPGEPQERPAVNPISPKPLNTSKETANPSKSRTFGVHHLNPNRSLPHLNSASGSQEYHPSGCFIRKSGIFRNRAAGYCPQSGVFAGGEG